MKELSSYDKQANDFLTKTNTTIKVEFLKHDFHFENDKEKRDIYTVTIQRGNRSFSFEFGNSIRNSGEYVSDKLSYIEKLCGKFCLTTQEFKKLWGEDRSYFEKNKSFEIPSNYSILCCLEKYEVGTFDDFCDNYGYSNDSILASKIYESVLKEYSNVCQIWSDEEIAELQEIQ